MPVSGGAMGAIPTNFPTVVSTTVSTVTDTVGSFAETIIGTFPLNLFVVLAILGLAIGFIKRFTN